MTADRLAQALERMLECFPVPIKGTCAEDGAWQARTVEAARADLAAYRSQSPAEAHDNVLVPLAVLEDASSAIGNFVSDHGWGDSDMQALDNLDAYIAQHKAKPQPKGLTSVCHIECDGCLDAGKCAFPGKPAEPVRYPHPDEDDAVTLWAEIHRLRAAVQGPDGYATWQEAATAERVRRVAAEKALAAAQAPAPAPESSGAKLALCPFCGRRPVLTVRPDNAEATSYFAAVACFCDGYAACAHKYATAAEADEAERLAREAWNRRTTAAPAVGDVSETYAPYWQGGLSNAELAQWWRLKTKAEPTDRDMSCFALGVEVGCGTNPAPKPESLGQAVAPEEKQ